MKLQLNKEEQDYKLIQIDGKFVVVDLNAKIAVGNCVLSQLEQIVTASANTIDLYNGGCRKVLAATSELNLPVFQLPEREDEVEKLAKKDIGYVDRHDDSDVVIWGRGYKAANKGYSEEELKKAMYHAAKLGQGRFGKVSKLQNREIWDSAIYADEIEDFIQSLNQPTLEIEFEEARGELISLGSDGTGNNYYETIDQIKSARWIR